MADADYDRLGEVIRSRRLELRLSQTGAADQAGVSYSTWRLVEKGAHPGVSDRTIIQIAEALELRANDLLALVGRKPVVMGLGLEPVVVPSFQDLVGLVVCTVCSAVVPERAEAQKNHERWHGAH